MGFSPNIIERKNKMKKKILAAAVCASVVLSLTACGKSENSLSSLPNQSNGTSSKPVSSASKPDAASSTPASSAASSAESKPESSTVQSVPESSTQESKSEESTPVVETVDWDTVPYADELDFMTEDCEGGVKITKYLGSEEVVKIPETFDGKAVVEIGGSRNVFDNDKVTDIKLPKATKIIGDEAFYDCRNLKSVDIPDGVTMIDGDAFWGLPSLKMITLPDSVTFINDDKGQSYPLIINYNITYKDKTYYCSEDNTDLSDVWSLIDTI